MCATKTKNQYEFSKNLSRAEHRVAKRSKEKYYVQRYLSTVINHIKDLADKNPGITSEELESLLFDEIDSYSDTIFHTSFVFQRYMEYIACQYLKKHKDQYINISEKLKNTGDGDFEIKNYQDCSTFDEYLMLYVYRLKTGLFKSVFDGYFDCTPKNIKHFDELLQENIVDLSKTFFKAHFDLPEISDTFKDSSLDKKGKQNKITTYSTWYRNAIDRQKFLKYANLFLNGSFSYIDNDTSEIEGELRDDLSKSISETVEQLDSLGHIDNYLAAFVVQMCQMGFPEYASPVCKNNMLNSKSVSEILHLTPRLSIEKAKELVDKNKFMTMLSKETLSSKKGYPIENLLVLNSFWSNRYIKELDLYSEAMFAIHSFDLIDKALSGEEVHLSIANINDMLIKMNTLYGPTCNFLEQMQDVADHSSKKDPEVYNDELDEKKVLISCDSFYNEILDSFGNDYQNYFSQILPSSDNDLLSDIEWYLKLYNPIHLSYEMKNEIINALVSSIDNSATSVFPNAGIILNDFSSDGVIPAFQSNVLIGIDCNTFPHRVHCKSDVLIAFLKSINGSAIMPIYEGSDDFIDPVTGNVISSHIILPLDPKSKFMKVLKESRKNLNKYNYPNFVAHLGFLDPKYPPEHLGTKMTKPNGKEQLVFIQRYIDLETGTIYIKDENGEYQLYSNMTKEKEAKEAHGSK